MLLLPVHPLYLRQSLLAQVVHWFVFPFVSGTLLCFLVSFSLVLCSKPAMWTLVFQLLCLQYHVELPLHACFNQIVRNSGTELGDWQSSNYRGLISCLKASLMII